MSKFLFAVAALVVLAPSAFSQTVTRYVVNPGSSATVRYNPGGFVIGNLYEGAHTWPTQSYSDSRWGRAGGNCNKCGWVYNSPLSPSGTGSATCSGSGRTDFGLPVRQGMVAEWAKTLNDYRPGTFFEAGVDDGNFVRVTANVHYYGNYDGNTFRDQRTTVSVPANTAVYWRWVSKNGEAALVRTGGAQWIFIRRDKLPASLPYSNGNSYTDP